MSVAAAATGEVRGGSKGRPTTLTPGPSRAGVEYSLDSYCAAGRTCDAAVMRSGHTLPRKRACDAVRAARCTQPAGKQGAEGPGGSGGAEVWRWKRLKVWGRGRGRDEAGGAGQSKGAARRRRRRVAGGKWSDSRCDCCKARCVQVADQSSSHPGPSAPRPPCCAPGIGRFRLSTPCSSNASPVGPQPAHLSYMRMQVSAWCGLAKVR